MSISPEGLAAIVGIFMPLVVSVLKRPGWPKWGKVAVAGVVSVAVGAATVYVSGEVELGGDLGRVFTAAAAAFTAATVVYKAWFAGLPLNDTLTKWPER